VTPSGIESATFRLVAQCLNQLRYRVLPVKYVWRWKHHDPSKCRLLLTYKYSITSQKTWIFVSSSVRTSHLGVYLDALYTVVLTAVTLSCVCFRSLLILSHFLCISSL